MVIKGALSECMRMPIYVCVTFDTSSRCNMALD